MTNDVLARLVVTALIFSAISFYWQFHRALARGRATTFAPARGDARRGAVYALTLGMNPRAKDGARRHPWVLVAGVLFHAGVGAAAITAVALFAARPGFSGPAWDAIATVQAAGAIAALSLIARRNASPMLRAISGSDDYVSNILVFATLVSGAGAIALPELVPMFATALTLVLVYAPFGKIRHCVLFFPARLQYGRFLGRRGVLPPASGADLSVRTRPRGSEQ